MDAVPLKTVIPEQEGITVYFHNLMNNKGL